MTDTTNIINRYNYFDENIVNDLKKGYYYDQENNNCVKTSLIKSIDRFYNTNGLFRKIINMPSRDATKKDIVIHNNKSKEILQELNKKQYRNYLEKAVRIARLYGCALIVLNIQTNENNTEKFDKEITKDDKINDFSIQYIFSPNEFYIEQNDNYPIDWDYYIINTDTKENNTKENNNIRIHKSRTILITYQELQRRADKLFDGSMFLHIFNDITRYIDTLDVEENLMIQSQYDILQISHDANKTIEEIQKENKAILRQNNFAKQNLGTQLLGVDDKISRIQSIFTGYAELTEKFKDIVCADASIPKMFLFGEIVSGLSNESNTTLSDYYSSVENLQEDCLRDACIRLIELVCRKLSIQIDEYNCFDFANMWQMDDKEKSEIMLNYSNTFEKAINNDFITREEARAFLEENKIIELNKNNLIQADTTKEENEQEKTKEEVLDIY